MSVVRFHDFELDASRRLLSHRGRPIKIGSRALDILAVLASRPGEVVSANEILKAVWPDSSSAENSLRVTVSALRKALSVSDAESIVQSVAGRGYILSAAVRGAGSSVEMAQLHQNKGNLPSRSTALLGREDFIDRCLELRHGRIMTIVGSGGIGKTTVALELAHRLQHEYEAVYFLDLAALSSTASIAPTLASLLGLAVYSDDALPGIIATLAHQRVLLVFDNCEHVISAAAAIVENITRMCANVFVLATSREPLSIQAETIRRLGSLDLPPLGDGLQYALDCPSVALFIKRMEHLSDLGASLESEQMATVAAIVRKLEGIPLAIEFAAARVVDLGLQELLASLDRPLTVLRRGRRTAPRRQQTLQGTLDWSYGFLTENEKEVMRAVSVFAHSFSREGVLALFGASFGQDEVEEAIWGLQSKSLLAKSESLNTLRLLESTREYAAIKLAASGQLNEVRSAHASLLLSQMHDAELQWDKLSTSEWITGYGMLIHDIRLALDFCEETGETHLFCQLLASSGLLWTQLGLMNEQFRHIERAMKSFDIVPAKDPLLESQLRSAYGSIAYNVHSVPGDIEARRQFELAARGARVVNDTSGLLRAGSGICALLTTQGRYREANVAAQQLVRDIGPIAGSAVDRILAHNSHYLALHDKADAHAKRALLANGQAVRGTQTSGASFGQKTLSLMVLAKTAYLRGNVAASLEYLDEMTSDALAVNHPISACLGLAVGACPIYFGLGQIESGQRFLEILRDIATKNSLVRWAEYVDGFDFALRGQHVNDEAVIANLKSGGNGPLLENVVTVAGKKAGPDLIELALSGQAEWCRSELLRLKGEILLEAGDVSGRELLIEGYAIASRQSALTWQLNCANSLAKHAASKTLAVGRERIDRTLPLFPERGVNGLLDA